MLSNVLKGPVEEVAVDLEVRVRFKKMNDEITLPCFVRA